MDIKYGTLFSKKATKEDVTTFSLINSMIILNHKYKLMKLNINRSDCFGVINLVATRYSILSFIDWCASLYDFLLLINNYSNSIEISPKIHSISSFYSDEEVKEKVKLLKQKKTKTMFLNLEDKFTNADRLRIIRNRHTHGLKNIKDYLLSFALIDYLIKEDLFIKTYQDFVEIFIVTQKNTVAYLKNKYGENLMLPRNLSHSD